MTFFPLSLSFTSFVDLKGLTFAYNDPVSLSGSLVVLGNLKKMGYDSSFFGNMLHSGVFCGFISASWKITQ